MGYKILSIDEVDVELTQGAISGLLKRLRWSRKQVSVVYYLPTRIRG